MTRFDHAVLVEQPADLLDQGGAGLDQPLPHAMQGLEVLRLDPFDRDKAHRGPGHGFADRFGIAGLVLRRLHMGFDEWGAISRTSCPWSRKHRAQSWALPPASIPIRSGGNVAIKRGNALRARRFLKPCGEEAGPFHYYRRGDPDQCRNATSCKKRSIG